MPQLKSKSKSYNPQSSSKIQDEQACNFIELPDSEKFPISDS